MAVLARGNLNVTFLLWLKKKKISKLQGKDFKLLLQERVLGGGSSPNPKYSFLNCHKYIRHFFTAPIQQWPCGIDGVKRKAYFRNEELTAWHNNPSSLTISRGLGNVAINTDKNDLKQLLPFVYYMLITLHSSHLVFLATLCLNYYNYYYFIGLSLRKLGHVPRVNDYKSQYSNPGLRLTCGSLPLRSSPAACSWWFCRVLADGLF